MDRTGEVGVKVVGSACGSSLWRWIGGGEAGVWRWFGARAGAGGFGGMHLTDFTILTNTSQN